MRFGYTIIYVQDVEVTLDFYEKAFGIASSFLHESMQYGELDTGDTKLAFASEALVESNGVHALPNRSERPEAPGFEIALVTDDVAGAYQKALAGGALHVTVPTEKPWGQIIAYVRDVNGILVELCSPMG
jgi:lactoylglutathione lyase